MTDAVLLTGKRGSGKTLLSVSYVVRALKQGRPIATNINFFPQHLVGPLNSTPIYRLPDFPTAMDLESLPPGNPDPVDEANNGLLILDECAAFLNSREWNAKDRLSLIAWLAQSRKYGWDLILIAQHARMIDAQLRDSLVDLHGIARRIDKIAIPFLSPVVKWATGRGLKFPKIHVVTLRYGFAANAPTADTFWFRGFHLFRGYDTLQKISNVTGNQNIFTVLPNWYTEGRYMNPRQIYGRVITIASIVGLAFGLLFGYLLGQYQPEKALPLVPEVLQKDVQVKGVLSVDDFPRLILSDGRVVVASSHKVDPLGERYFAEGKWYGVQK